MAHSFSASVRSSSLVSRVWDGPSVKAPLELSSAGFSFVIVLIPEVSGSGHWQGGGGGSEHNVLLVRTDWDEIRKEKNQKHNGEG